VLNGCLTVSLALFYIKVNISLRIGKMKQRFSSKKNYPKYRFTFPLSSLNLKGDTLLIDKPYACSSFDIVNQLKTGCKELTGQRIKVGHAGTLDPLATGLLVVCIGQNTKEIAAIQDLEKEYIGTFRLGATTPSYDLEHPIDRLFSYEHITREMAEEAATSFLGEIEQIPPVYSAIKIKGKRAYELARQNISVEILPKQVVIHEFSITRFELPEIDFKIVCSKGTYIRAIARDLGERLNSGAHLSLLCRTRIGGFTIEDALPISFEIVQPNDN
jgi:tRNA pseudouridine55 synthase